MWAMTPQLVKADKVRLPECTVCTYTRLVTHDQIITSLGGPASVARQIGCHHAQPVRWRVRGIPPCRWRQVERLAKKAGKPDITVSLIAETAPAERDRP
jgi:hypothetical protein